MKLRRIIDLGGPPQPSLARRGEAIFYDAQRSFHQWFSCHTCHADGHTNHANFDTLNDGRYGNVKKTLSLRGVTHTGPWTWHGRQQSLDDSVISSLKTTMQGRPPSDEEVKALVAFLGTLDVPPNPFRQRDGSLSESARRGAALFQDRGCGRCHAGPHLTSTGAFDVGTAEGYDAYAGYNPPSLLNVYGRAPYLHDGRARSLDELLRLYHRPEKLSGGALMTDEERRALVEFLKSA
jgi:cytochrome c peroxidase